MDREMLGRFIARRRKEKGLTQRELAQILHVTDKAVSRWERGIGCPDVMTLEPLAAALGLNVDQLLTCCVPPAETEAASVEQLPAPTSEAVQAVLDLSHNEVRNHRRRCRWITLAAVLTVAALATLYLILSGLQRQGKLFVQQRSISPDGVISVVAYQTGGKQAIRVERPTVIAAWGGSDLSGIYGDAKITGLSWSEDSTYLAVSLHSTVSEAQRPACCELWYFYRNGADSTLCGQKYDLYMKLAGLWLAGDEKLTGLPAVDRTQPDGYPVFDLAAGGWEDDTLLLACTYTGTDGVVYSAVIRYDCREQNVISVTL